MYIHHQLFQLVSTDLVLCRTPHVDANSHLREYSGLYKKTSTYFLKILTQQNVPLVETSTKQSNTSTGYEIFNDSSSDIPSNFSK